MSQITIIQFSNCIFSIFHFYRCVGFFSNGYARSPMASVLAPSAVEADVAPGDVTAVDPPNEAVAVPAVVDESAAAAPETDAKRRRLEVCE